MGGAAGPGEDASVVNPRPFDDQALEAERIRTTAFVDGVCERLGWERHHDPGVVEAIEVGLSRNMLAFGARFCPCYMPGSYFKDDGKKNPAAICPCPAAVRMDLDPAGAYGPFETRELLESRTRDWPAPGPIEQRDDGWYMVSPHPGIDH
jgi:ferredoxin-thioredoxin reductase catalytic subunit